MFTGSCSHFTYRHRPSRPQSASRKHSVDFVVKPSSQRSPGVVVRRGDSLPGNRIAGESAVGNVVFGDSPTDNGIIGDRSRTGISGDLGRNNEKGLSPGAPSGSRNICQSDQGSIQGSVDIRDLDSNQSAVNMDANVASDKEVSVDVKTFFNEMGTKR